jgi:hypothetical protein
VGVTESDWRPPGNGPAVGPPPRLSQQQPPLYPPPPPPPPGHSGAWQGAIKPPVFVVGNGRAPERPTYREPLPVRSGRVWAGAGVAALWMLLFGVQASSVRAYAWITIVAAVLAWCVAAVLARFGDRGAAVGIAISTCLGVTVVGVIGAVQAFHGHWILW